MTVHPSNSYASKLAALTEDDLDGAAELVDKYAAQILAADDVPSGQEALAILATLRAHRHFGLLSRAAEAQEVAGLAAAPLRIHYAQALIEQGQLIAAHTVLDAVLADSTATMVDLTECRGLLGRTYKQRYVHSGDAAPGRRSALLTRSIEQYAGVYESAPGALWHAINAAALLLHAGRVGLPVAPWPHPAERAREIARDVLTTLASADCPRSRWDRAIAFEAHLALDDTAAALRELAADLADPFRDRFSVGGLLRQLTEIWLLRADQPPGRTLLPLVQGRLLKTEGGRLDLDAADLAAGRTRPPHYLVGLEKIFGTYLYQTRQWFQDLLDQCRAVARISNRHRNPVGTGFLLPGQALDPGWPELVLMTNEHVIDAGARLDDFEVQFLGTGQLFSTRPQRQLCWSPREELDYNVVELADTPPGAIGCRVASRVPDPHADPPPRVFIAGHPRGSDEVQIAVCDNELLASDEWRLHYRCPTEGAAPAAPYSTPTGT